MRSAILNFPTQFQFEPKIENSEKLGNYKQFIVCGMGGSHLAGDLLLPWNPALPVIIHSDYGLPANLTNDSLAIISSYSGNTEEALDALRLALEQKLPVAAIAVGGKLLEIAEKEGIPFIKMPNTGIQPRSALGFSLRGILSLMKQEKGFQETSELSKLLSPEQWENEGKKLAKKIENKIPVIYSSTRNKAVAYNWKIKINETGKTPAFYNVFPELNHNEMTGFDAQLANRHLSENFHFIFLKDKSDHPRIQKRMKILVKLFEDRRLPVEILELSGKHTFEKIFNSLLLADWFSYYTAEQYGLEFEQVPMVEEFKKLM